MTRLKYELNFAIGRLCYLLYVHFPWSNRLPNWVLAKAGFYANDERNQSDAPEGKHVEP